MNVVMAILTYVLTWVVMNVVLLWSILAFRGVIGEVSKDDVRQGLLAGAVLVLLNVGLLLWFDDPSFMEHPVRYAEVFFGAVLIFRSLTVRIGTQGEAGVSAAVPSAHDATAVDVDSSTESSSLARDVARFASALSGRTKMVLIVGGVALAAILISVKVTSSVRAAWNYKLEGDYAQREAAGIAQFEADEQAAQAGTRAESTSADEGDDGSTGSGLTPNGHDRWTQLADILALAPADGSVQHAMVTYTAAGGDAGSFLLEVDDIALGGSDPAYIHDVELFGDELGACYVDDRHVSGDQFFEFVSAGSGLLGSIEFTGEGITRSSAYSEDFVPANGY